MERRIVLPKKAQGPWAFIWVHTTPVFKNLLTLIGGVTLAMFLIWAFWGHA